MGTKGTFEQFSGDAHTLIAEDGGVQEREYGFAEHFRFSGELSFLARILVTASRIYGCHVSFYPLSIPNSSMSTKALPLHMTVSKPITMISSTLCRRWPLAAAGPLSA
jgi:hypothetical protein